MALEAAAQALAGVVAAERLRLPARIEASLRQAAAEVAELMVPRVWPFGDRRSGPADRQFLLDLLDDAVFEATAVTARELAAAAEGGPALDIAGFIERFRAYARGVWRGGLADDILREQAGGAPAGPAPPPTWPSCSGCWPGGPPTSRANCCARSRPRRPRPRPTPAPPRPPPGPGPSCSA